MHKALQRMWDIEQQQDESQTQQEFPTTISEATKLKLKLFKLGTGEEYEERDRELDLDQYLQTQRANTKARVAKPKPKTAQQLQKEKEYKQGYGKGFKMLQKMGFNVGKGLGKNQQGRTNIVEAQFKTSLTTRDEDYEEEQQRERLKEEKQNEQKQQINPYNQFQFQQIFQYKSGVQSINNLLFSLKNKYEIFRNKLDLLRKETQSFDKDMQISESLKIQKRNQIKLINDEIQGLQQIHKNASNVEKYPHLGLAYNADLLIIKEAIEKLQPMDLKKIVGILKQEINRTKDTLSSLYLAKERQALKLYNQTTGFQLRMKGFFMKNKKDNIGAIKVNKDLYGQQIKEDEVTVISQEDAEKIKKYLKLILDEGVIKNKLDSYLMKLGDISRCEEHAIDLMEIIRNLSKQLTEQIKQKYLIPLANNYLLHYKHQPDRRKLPHLVIFPWMQIFRVGQLNISGFLRNISTKLWSIENDDLYNIISPWLVFISVQQKQFFISFYLAPRLLYEMEEFSLTASSSNQKEKIKGFMKYCELLPMNLREEIIQNSIAVSVLTKYQKQLEQDASLKDDLKNWVLKWAEKIDKICQGVIKKVFLESKIIDIWS